MKIAIRKFSVVAAKGDSFSKGDRVASNWEGEWYLATITKVESNLDCGIKYDTGGADTYPRSYMNSANIIKLPPTTAKNKGIFTKKEVQAMAKSAVIAPPTGARFVPTGATVEAKFKSTMAALAKAFNQPPTWFMQPVDFVNSNPPMREAIAQLSTIPGYSVTKYWDWVRASLDPALIGMFGPRKPGGYPWELAGGIQVSFNAAVLRVAMPLPAKLK